MAWLCLVLFGVAFSATVLATPRVIGLAHRLGAVDSPDGFRKTHLGSTPRLGGLAVVCGLMVAAIFLRFLNPSLTFDTLAQMRTGGICAASALLLILVVGVVDDLRGLSATVKLFFQAIAACLLYFDGFDIQKIFVFGLTIDFGWLALPATVFWFLACMNIWNLIDGMDGLASGVGIIVAATLMVASKVLGHVEVSFAAAALVGALAGFLLFNFHPAKIFLGDSGSLLIGTLLGMFAIQGSLKSGMTVAILAPILAMGLPIVDTLMAIVRRWIRHLPWNAPDHGHIHHRLIAFGLSQRQASLFLYSFTVVLCACALASIALQSDSLALLMAMAVTLGLTAVFAARREDCARFFEDFRRRLMHRRVEQQAARIVWEAIQRLGNCHAVDKAADVVVDMARKLECGVVRVHYVQMGRKLIDCHRQFSLPSGSDSNFGGEKLTRTARLAFSLADDQRRLELEFDQRDNRPVPLTVGSRFLSRLANELLERLRQIHLEEEGIWLNSAKPATEAARASGWRGTFGVRPVEAGTLAR